MRTRYALILAAFALFAGATAHAAGTAPRVTRDGAACPGNLLLDPGFELGLPNPHWTASYAVGGYEILVEDAGAAHAGSWLARMGYPPDSEETGAVSQSVVIPAAGGATLGFWLRLEPDAPLPTDTFYVRVDGADLLTVPASSTDYSGAYHYVELDASAYADGGTHEVAFVFEFYGQDWTTVSIDDVCLTIQEPVCPGNLLLDPGFELGLPNPHWTASYAVGGYDILVDNAAGAHAGSWLARMGYPPDSEETGAVSQSVVIPAAGGATLGFWLRLEPDDPLPTDTFYVRIDGVDLLAVPASSTDYSGAYHYVELDASAYADGGTHEVAFVFEFYGQDWTTVSIDDVCLTAGVSGEGEGEGEEDAHAADQDGDNRISLTELLRLIQFFNSGGFHCAADPGDTEDGYVPGTAANTGCAPHSSDYHPAGPDWTISLTELLRLIQFFNSGGYHYCPEAGTEDGYCPGPG